MKQLCKLGDEEVVVLEQGKDAKVKHNVERRPCLRLLPGLCFSDKQTASPRTERGESNEQQKPPVPPSIEHITGHHHKSVLQSQLLLRLADKAVEDEPIEQEDYWEEYRELDGVEKHNALCCIVVAKVKIILYMRNKKQILKKSIKKVSFSVLKNAYGI